MKNNNPKEIIKNYLIENKYLKENESDESVISQAFTLFCLEKILSFNHNNIEKFRKFVTDGHGDNGIDAIFWDKKERILHIIQTKFSENTKGIETIIKAFTSSVSSLLSGNIKYLEDNERMKIAGLEVEKWKNSREENSRIKCYFITICQKKTKNTLDALMETINENSAENMEFEFLSIDNVIEWASPFKRVSSITMNLDKQKTIYYKQDGAYGVCITIVKAKELIQNLKKYIENETVFSMNLRNPLKENKISSEIKKTIENESEQFIKYNNGITMICKKIDRYNNENKYSITDFSIVNGAQTLTSLYRANKFDKLSDNCYISMKMLEANDEIGNKISMYSNSQNVVKKFDNFSFLPLNKNLYKLFFVKNIEYKFKRGKRIQKNKKTIEADILLRLTACFLSETKEEASFVLSSCKNAFNKLYNEHENEYWNKNKEFLENEDNIDKIIQFYFIFKELMNYLKIYKKNDDLKKSNNIEYLLFVMLIRANNIKNEIFQSKINEKTNEYVEVVWKAIKEMLESNPASYKSQLTIMKNKNSILDLLDNSQIALLLKFDT